MRPEELRDKEYEKVSELEFNDRKIIEQLSEAAKILKDKVSLTKNIGIKNRASEKKRFLEAKENGERFRPGFEFREFQENSDKILELLEQCRDASERISEENLEKYGAKRITAEELSEFFDQLFRELELYAKLALNIENEEKWRRTCKEIWPMASEGAVKESKRIAPEIEEERYEQNLDAEDVKRMFEAEFRRLGVDYEVEVREVSGCFNIPEEQKLIVARGEEEERKFSRKEAEMLTMHETFHSIRAYNGAKAGENSGFPDILGVHTPFYDQTEEGGAIYREHETDTSYSVKEKKYHLMRIAAYEVSQSDNYVEEFEDITETLTEHGASPEQAFSLAARNREVLRHHIYQTGYEQWQEMEDVEKMLIGKLSQKWAEKFWKEAEAEGMLELPEVTADQLFNFSFKD